LNINNVIYSGYFQSFKYFQNIEKTVRKLFEIKPYYQDLFHRTAGKWFEKKKTLAIHIRRSDYLNWKDEQLNIVNPTLPLSYYRKCLKLIDKLSDYQIIFVSDDIDFVRSEFSDYHDAAFVKFDAIVDFQIILNSDIIILSNSTFGWWAAFLNSKKDKQVFAPKNWLGYNHSCEFPKGIFDNLNWNLID